MSTLGGISLSWKCCCFAHVHVHKSCHSLADEREPWKSLRKNLLLSSNLLVLSWKCLTFSVGSVENIHLFEELRKQLRVDMGAQKTLKRREKCHNEIHCGENEHIMQILHLLAYGSEPSKRRRAELIIQLASFPLSVISSDLFLISLIAATFPLSRGGSPRCCCMCSDILNY